jgi:subtilase family serine protease
VRATRRCYSPDQIRTAYSIKPLYAGGFDGTGRTIVIIDAFQSPTINQDLALFDSTFGLPAPPAFNIIAPDGLTPFDPTDGNQVGWSAEISLDVEWAHAIAPGATIDLVLAKSNQDADILSATKYAIDNNLGDVISQSFGEAEQCMDPSLLAQQHALFNQAIAKGITLFASAGDQGAAQPTCDGSSFFKAASTPASDPNVTSVGGTQLHATPVVLSPPPPPFTITDPGGAYQSENVWNDGSPGVNGDAGGGGFSVVYPRPVYQAPVVKKNGRAVPDVAYNAAVDGGVLGAWGVPFGVGAFFRFGGTSAGSPQWAGLLAIGDQMAGARQGNINKTLYILGQDSQSTYFHDVTVGNNTFYDFATDGNGNPIDIPGFPATPGFDEASGWGSPIASMLIPAIAKPGNGN